MSPHDLMTALLATPGVVGVEFRSPGFEVRVGLASMDWTARRAVVELVERYVAEEPLVTAAAVRFSFPEPENFMQHLATGQGANGEHEHQWVAVTDFDDGDQVREQCTVSGCGLVRATPRGRRAGEDDDELRHCQFCGAVCDHRVQVCECGPDCPLPPVAR